MLTTTDTVTLDLGSTATYAARTCEWVPVAPGEGLLVVRVRKSPRGKEEASLYAVEEQDSGHPDVREFLVENPDNPLQGDTYRVTVGGPLAGCTCKAGSVKRHLCKHWSALAELVKEGAVQPLSKGDL